MAKVSVRLRLLLLVVALIMLAPQAWSGPQVPTAEGASFKIVGYVPAWQGSIAEIQFDKLTHVIYAFAVPADSGDGSLKPLENPSKLSSLVSAARSRNVKVLLAVGGWNDGNDQGFERLAANHDATTRFINNLVGLVNQYNLDGIDIDWEYPDPDSPSARNFATLMQRLSTEMRNRGKLLTAAVISHGYYGGGVPSEVFNYVDFLNLMAYDGGDGAAHSPYSLAVDSLNYWTGRGLPASKAILGVPFYGRPTWATYRTLVAHNSQAPYRDSIQYNGTTVHYNGIQTIKDKTNLALQRGGGIMIWELSHDTTDSTSLLRAIYETAGGTQPPATSQPTATPSSGSCSAPAWSPSKVYYGGDIVSHNGRQWRAEWWTQGEEPGTTGQWGVWRDQGACSGGTNPTATPRPATATPAPQPTATSAPQPTATPSSGVQQWAPNTYYAVGALASYNGRIYKAIQAHTSQVGWEPPNVPALWSAQ